MNQVNQFAVNRHTKLRYGAAACMLALSIGLSACGGENAIDAPPTEVEQEMLRQVEADSKGVNGTSLLHNNEKLQSNMTVYVRDRHGYLAPVAYQLDGKDTAALAKQGLDLLIEGSPSASKLPSGFSATLPKQTVVNSVTIQPDQKLAVVELSKGFAAYEPEQERRILESLVWSLTSLPEVQQVQLWVDSQRLTEMPVNKTPIDSNLTRSFGINLEKGEGVNYMQSMPVMLYFTSLTEDGKSTYYIPVTRLVKPAEDKVTAVLEQMIAGPQDKSAMSRVATLETQLKNWQRDGDTLAVEFTDSMFEQGDKIPAELLHSVVLTLTELPNVAKVQISINGMKDIQGNDHKDYSQPVARPVINQAYKG